MPIPSSAAISSSVVIPPAAVELQLPPTLPDLHLSGTTDLSTPALSQPELRPGTDVEGRPVAPADLAAGPVPVPGQVMIPLKANGGAGYVMADGKKLDVLLNPKAACKIDI